ncbi:MAG: tetratricopeptide repeat protein [Desulfovibrionales bacterium]
MSAIGELSAAVKNNPDAVEIYLALGNLFRAQGELERAIQIRNSLIVRQNVEEEFKAKAWFEMGRDYKRAGFLDRAQSAFEQARVLLGDDPVILEEMARLAADSGEYEKASHFYSRLKNTTAEAYYLVRLAHESWMQNDRTAGKKWLNKAMKVNPGSVEGWLEILYRSYLGNGPKQFAQDVRKALNTVPDRFRFVVLEGILEFPSHASSHEDDSGEKSSRFDEEFCRYLLPVLEEENDDILLFYYGAWIALKCGNPENARSWFEKTLLLDPDFWPARLELLANSLDEQTLTAEFKVQLEFFLKRARRVKRFVCLKCGLKREQTFLVCTRCQAWYSISFRLSLSD